MTEEPAPDQPPQQTHDYYGVPLWLMKDYLLRLGGSELPGDIVTGEGWRAELRKAAPRRIGSLAVGGTTATFFGEDEALQRLFAELHWKTQRGGG